MTKQLQLVLDWAEVWALFIPLGILLFNPKQPTYLKPVILYLFIALLLNLVGNVIADFKSYLPSWLHSNNPLYNLHSVVRYACFTAFFLALSQPFYTQLKKTIPFILLVLIMLNFLFREDFFYRNSLSGDLLAAEAYFLLVYCLLYYLSQLKVEEANIFRGPDFWVATGLCIYVVINLFVFLFYIPMIAKNPDLADRMWSVHNVAYILLSFFIAKAFYISPRNEY